MDNNNKINVLMIGTGEYTTGFVNGASSTSDKKVRNVIPSGFIIGLDWHRYLGWSGCVDHVRPSSSG